MIIDSHCHTWERWPYDPPVPDPATRGSSDQVIFEMARNGVAHAIVIPAAIRDNAENNVYVAREARRFGGRLVPFVDIDSRWSATYHTQGAADRFEEICERWQPVGFTHYLREDDEAAADWFRTADGRAFFAAAARRKLIASIACAPCHLPAICETAGDFPGVPILCHHLARLGPRTRAMPGALAKVLAAANVANIYVKISGFGNVCGPEHDYPYPDVRWIVTALYDALGPWRLVWGSDFPVSRQYMTYRQTVDILRKHCASLPQEDVGIILGESMGRLLEERGIALSR